MWGLLVILGLDGLEYEYVLEFNCKNLMQEHYGKTDISMFKEPRTVVIWSSFLAGRNLENEILKHEDLWSFRLKPEQTFFSKYKKWEAIDVPGFTHKYEEHKQERELLKGFFDGTVTVQEYDEAAFRHHRQNKQEFNEALQQDLEILMGYFPLADTIGHLSFGVKTKMKIIYRELDSIAGKVRLAGHRLLIISDHGMKPVGRFGDHTNYGYYSTNFKIDLGKPGITQFRKIIEDFTYKSRE